MDYDDLISKFGSGKGTANAVVTPHADLISRFGSGDIAATAPVVPAEPQPQVPYNPDGTPAGAPRFVGNTPDQLPISYGDRVKQDFLAARDQASRGVSEVSQGLSATGVGNAAMGALMMPLSLVTPALKSIEETISQALPGAPNKALSPTTGKEINLAPTGERAMMVLPIKGTGHYVSSKMPSNIAVKNLIDAIGKENLPEVIRRMKANDRISPIDVSNSALQVAQKLAVTEGKHQHDLSAFSQARVGGSGDAVKLAFDETLGVPVNALEKINKMKNDARETGATLINPLVEKAKPADITDVIRNLDEGFGKDPVAAQTLKQLKAGEPISGPGMSAYQQRLFELRQDLRGDWTEKDKMFLDVKGEQGLHQKQIDLRREAQDLIDSPDRSNQRLGQRLMNVRDKYVEAIDKASPGYKEALGKYANDMEVQEAFERGFSLFSKSPKITNRPEFLDAELKAMKPTAAEAMREGGRIAIDSLTRGFKNSARKGEDLVASEFNADKIKALYGEKEAKALINRLQDERAISNTDTKLYQNSQTAMRLKNDSRVIEPDTKDHTLTKLLPIAAEVGGLMTTGQLGIGTGVYLGAKGLSKYGIAPVVNSYGRKQNSELTKLITSTGEEREQLIKVLESQISNNAPNKTLQAIHRLALPIAAP